MAATTITKALTGYFNTTDSRKVPAKEWLMELKALTDAEKLELAESVCAITGDTLTASK